jgi:hypothetical protein
MVSSPQTIQPDIQSITTLEELQDRIALLEYGPNALKQLLADHNSTGYTTICTCEACLICKRFASTDLEELIDTFKDCSERPCILKRCLKIQLDKLGLSYHCHEHDLIRVDSDSNEEESSDQDDENPDDHDDCHIIIETTGNYWEVLYGKKFGEERGFHSHPDMPKLKTLFSLLESDEDCPQFFQDGEINHYTIAENRSETEEM